MSEPAINHKEAWDLAHFRAEESNLARCYIELHTAAKNVVETYYIASGRVRDAEGNDGHDPLRALRIIIDQAEKTP